jgi:hypothetical protein
MMSRVRALLVAALLVLAFVAQAAAFMRSNSLTTDECVYVAGGYAILATHRFGFNREHPPVAKILEALPVYLTQPPPAARAFLDADTELPQHDEFTLGADFLYGGPAPEARVLALARSMNVAMGAVIVLLVGAWARRLFGTRAGLLAMAFAAFEPNLVAHASLATLDVPSALFTLVAMYALWEHVHSERPFTAWLVLSGLGAGAAALTKFSNVAVFATLGACLLADALLSRAGAWARVRDLVVRFGAVVLVATALVPFAYFFRGSRDLFLGVAAQMEHNAEGHPAFLLGELSQNGWWYYFPIAFAVKTPLGVLAAILAALGAWRWLAPLRRRDAVFVLLPPLALFVVMTRVRVDIGVRYVLPAYPFLLVLAGRLATLRAPWRAWVNVAVIAAPLAAAVASAMRSAPHQLSYFNEAAGGTEGGARILSDSNIDWGQDLPALAAYERAEHLDQGMYLAYFGMARPGKEGIPYRWVAVRERPPNPPPPGPLPKRLAVSRMFLDGVLLQGTPLAHAFEWLRARRPRASLNGSILVFDVDDPAAHAALAATYRTFADQFHRSQINAWAEVEDAAASGGAP